ncbi:mediator of RNA polymerase II transcription subunit 23-like [Zophobas morio]|uniref:mediator of RNA polymerase II transcription subunit 23-like n=1 Tax=Zophobas morio TaxID=2755281 RepID=UPI00308386B0
MKDRFTLKYVQVQFCALSIALEAESEGDHRFVEYRSFQEQLLSEFVMELLVLPYSAAELSRLLLNCVLYPSLAQPHEGSMAGRINALTHIYRLTPEGFRTELFVTMAQLLGANFDAPLQDYAFSKTLGFDMSASHITLVVAQSLLAHAQVTWQTDIPRFLEFLQRCKSPKEDRSLITTFEQVLYICHMVGPFLESMDDFALKNEAKERPILEQVFLALLELILQVSINYAEDSNLIPAEDAVVDFLYYVSDRYALRGDVYKRAESLILKMSERLKRRFQFLVSLP